MRLFIRILTFFVFIVFLGACTGREVTFITLKDTSQREKYGIEKLVDAIMDAGMNVEQEQAALFSSKKQTIIIGALNDTAFVNLCNNIGFTFDYVPGKEGYIIKSQDNKVVVGGSDASGILYGCLELAGRIKKSKKIPKDLDFIDQPEMVLRGACIGLQKTTYLPGRDVYEYPYTPDNFPWFYNKELWIKYLDMLVENRMNSLYLWNGHPFASLVKLDDYPFAVEVDDSTFALNEEMFGFLTEEANKRGIWVIQMFYNIIVSKPFAEHFNIETQDRGRAIDPIISDYTRKSIAAFIEKYPNVGLMVCLGEAMGEVDDDIEWFTKTIIPGVQDGIKALGLLHEPPIILRGHDTKPDSVMKVALPLYHNLYTTQKYNGESLTTYQPRGNWASVHQELSKLGSVHISNVHILANLEPFRYGAADFIQKCVIAMHDIQGAKGLHLYPQASYWDWPYTADNTNPRLYQVDRDWVWYKAWGRYAWNCRRDSLEEHTYWTEELGNYYGCGEYGSDIIEAYNEMGQIAPKLLRRFGITDGNRQTLLLGMFMSQLVNPYKWRVYSSFYNSNGPEGEILIDYVEKEWKGEAHIGETPPQIIEEVVQNGRNALEAIEKAAPHVKKHNAEFARLKNDVYCYNAIANFFSEKVQAAMLVLRYKYSSDVNDLEMALPHVEKSVSHYEDLVNLTKDTYLYANSMQTKQRRIPIDGTDGKYKSWIELLPLYQDEMENFRNNITTLKSEGGAVKADPLPLKAAQVEILNKSYGMFPLKKGQKVYTDENYVIEGICPEMQNLKGIRVSYKAQQEEGTTIWFKNDKPVKVVVGFFNGHSYKILQPPSLETDASANNRGQTDIRIANAMDIPGLYPVNIYTYKYEAGENELKLGKGIVLVLGFIGGDEEIIMRDAGLGTGDTNQGVDWLFY
ncbi:MAG: hypothetical protein JXB49_36285 [Bacteroidales bacterium]|nr:hypothetical protein [Bacteroidales bacterium]